MFSEAEAYERFMGRWSRQLAPALVQFAEVRDSNAVLDVGAGTGALSAAVLTATQRARVTGVDLSASYVEYANRKHGGPRARFETGDAQRLQLADRAFDRTISLLVVNFIPDRARALKEMIRVTKPGGVVAAAVWDYGEGMEMLRVFWDVATALDPAIASRDERHMPLCRAGDLSAAWQQAGLAAVREAPLTATLRFSSFADYWEPFLLGQGPAGAYAAQLPDERQAELRAHLRKRLLGTGPDHPFQLQARAWAVKGTRP